MLLEAECPVWYLRYSFLNHYAAINPPAAVGGMLLARQTLRTPAQKVSGMKLQVLPLLCPLLQPMQCSGSSITSDNEQSSSLTMWIYIRPWRLEKPWDVFTHQSPKAMMLQSHPTLDVSFSPVPVWKPKHSQYSGFETQMYSAKLKTPYL